MARNARAERHLIAVVEGRLEPAPAVLANGAAAWSSATDRRCCMPLWRDRSPARRRPARCSYVLSRVVCVGGQCGTGQGSATREGKLLLGHDVLAALRGMGSQQRGRRIVLRTARKRRQPILGPDPAAGSDQARGRWWKTSRAT